MKKPIPYTDSRYMLDDDFNVHDTVTDQPIPYKEGKVKLHFISGVAEVSKAFVMLLVYKPLYKLPHSFLNWRVAYKDEDQTNLSLINLYWKPPLGGDEMIDKPGFKIIPGHTGYAVNNCGDIWTRLYNKIIRKYLDHDGYYRTVTGKRDYLNVKCKMRVNRAVALAWIECDVDYDLMQANHINAIKTDDRVENLEWLTNRDNQKHAVDNNLANSNVNLLILDIETNQQYYLNTIIDASRFLSTYPVMLRDILRKRPNELINGKYRIIEFGELHRIEYEDTVYVKYSEDCVGYSLLEDKIYIFRNPHEAVLFTGLKRETVRNKLYYANPWPNKNWCFMWLDDFTKRGSFRKFSKEEVVFFKDRDGIKNPYVVTNIDTGERVFVESIMEVSKQYKLTQSYILSLSNTNEIYETPNGRYRMEPLKL